MALKDKLKYWILLKLTIPLLMSGLFYTSASQFFKFCLYKRHGQNITEAKYKPVEV
jgi:hypothetical protein